MILKRGPEAVAGRFAERVTLFARLQRKLSSGSVAILSTKISGMSILHPRAGATYS